MNGPLHHGYTTIISAQARQPEPWAMPNAYICRSRLAQEVFGVVGIAIDGRPLGAFENSIMLSILGECPCP